MSARHRCAWSLNESNQATCTQRNGSPGPGGGREGPALRGALTEARPLRLHLGQRVGRTHGAVSQTGAQAREALSHLPRQISRDTPWPDREDEPPERGSATVSTAHITPAHRHPPQAASPCFMNESQGGQQSGSCLAKHIILRWPTTNSIATASAQPLTQTKRKKYLAFLSWSLQKLV